MLVEKLRRIGRFGFYMSLCENAMGCQYKLCNQYIRFTSLVHTLAELNENQHLSVQFEELLCIIRFGRTGQWGKNGGSFTDAPLKQPLADDQTDERGHQSLKWYHGREISKVV